MRIVIVGAGTVGTKIAQELIAENRDVVIIEKNPETARIIDNELDCLVINEDGSVPETLKRVQLEQTDWFLALTGSDSVNIVSCGLASVESMRPKTIARVETPFYSTFSKSQQKLFGLNQLVNPAMEAAKSIVKIIKEGFAESVVPLHEGALQLRMVHLDNYQQFIGMTLAEMRQTSNAHFLVVAIVRHSKIIVPQGATRIEKEDRLYFLGQASELDSFLGSVAGIKDKVHRLLLIGTSRISEQLISLLIDKSSKKAKNRFSSTFLPSIKQKKMDIILLEKSMETCKQFAQKFQNIQVMQGDPQEENILESARVTRSDLCIASSENQYKNICLAELAKILGSKKTIAVVSNDRFLPLNPHLNIDSYICSTDAIVTAVLSSIRRAHIKTIYSFFEDEVEIVELQLVPESSFIGKNLKEIELPKDVLLAFIIRDSNVLVPSGLTILKKHDIIAIVCRKKNIPTLETIFGGNDGI